MEEAVAISNLRSQFRIQPDEIAKQIGLSTRMIESYLSIMMLPDFVHAALYEEKISGLHATALLKLVDEKSQKEVLEKIIQNDMSGKATNDLINKILSLNNYL
jgi:ParB family chromosome partitioning protein